MSTQTPLSDQTEHVIYTLIKDGRFVITDHVSCYFIERCDDCPLQRKDCETARDAYVLKHYPELCV